MAGLFLWISDVGISISDLFFLDLFRNPEIKKSDIEFPICLFRIFSKIRNGVAFLSTFETNKSEKSKIENPK